MKKYASAEIFLALLLLFTLCGCETFRKTFSRPPRSMRSAPRRTQSTKPRRHGETGDKLFDTVFHRGKPQSRQQIHSSELNRQERGLAESSFSTLPRNANDDPDIRKIREKNQRSKNRRSDDVFGTRNGRFF